VELIKKQAECGEQYALIFMDCSMPILDGYEATTEIRKVCSNIRLDQPYIVACTGHTENEFILKAWRHKMDEIVPKPAKIEVISKILESLIRINN
jgi:CheY-like chemotaxis protein